MVRADPVGTELTSRPDVRCDKECRVARPEDIVRSRKGREARSVKRHNHRKVATQSFRSMAVMSWMAGLPECSEIAVCVSRAIC